MNLNGFIFPAPKAHYAYKGLAKSLFFVPRQVSGKQGTDFSHASPVGPAGARHIPCYFREFRGGSSKILLYFHGNAEDIGKAQDFMDLMSEELKVHVIAMEYVGYGIYPGSPTAELISDDAFNVYDYIHSCMKWEEENIIIFGRSIGTGFATLVAASRNPGMLILMSSFTSIKDVVKYMACMLTMMVADRLRNIDLIPAVKCPKLFIHGLQDSFVPAAFTQELFAAAKEPKKAHYGAEMTHNTFDMYEDLIGPILQYMEECHLNVQAVGLRDELPVKPGELPAEFRTEENEDKHWSCSL